MTMTIAEGEVVLSANLDRARNDVAKGVGSLGSAGAGNALKSGLKLGGKIVGGILATAGGAALGAVGVVAGTALSKGLDRALSIQDATAKLTGLGHSGKDVQGIMNNALASVKGTAFGLGDAAGVAAGAVASGIKPGQELQRVLGLVADSATIAGTDMGSMGSIFNKVAASGKLQGDVIAQLQDSGVPVLSFVAKQMGVTAGEAADLASKGKVSFATFADAMEAGLGGAALSSGDTARGAWANVQAALGRLGVSFLSGGVAKAPMLFTAVSGATDRASAALAPYADIINNRVAGAMVTLAARIDGINFDTVVSRVAGFVGTVQTKFAQVKTAVASAFSGGSGVDTSKVFGNLGQIGNVIAPLMPIFVSLGQAIGSISGSIGQLIGSGVQLLPPVITILSNALQFLADHSALVGPLILTIAGAMVVFKSAQAAANAAELGALPIRAANVAALFAQAGANRALATQMAIANGQQVASRLSMLPATAQVIAQTAAKVAGAVATGALATASGIATAAQWAWNVALTANPIGIVVVAIAALVGGLIWFFTQTKLGQAVWAGFTSFLGTSWTWIQNTVGAGLSFLGGLWSTTWAAVSAVGRAVWAGIVGYVTAGNNAVRAVVTATVGAVRAVWSAGWNAARSLIVAVVAGIVGAARSMASGVSGAVGTAVNAARNLASSIGSAVGSAIGFFLSMPGRIIGALSGLGGQLAGVGRNLMQGFINGVSGFAGRMISAVTAPISGAISAAKGMLGIHSPSRVFRQIGDYVGQGLVQGLKGSTSGVLAASKRMSNAIGQAFESGDLRESAAHGAYLAINAGTALLARAADQRASVANRLKAAQTALSKATKTRDDYRKSVTDGLTKFDVSKATSSGNLLQTLRNRVAQTKTFTTVMSKLRKAGLDATSYQQFIASGVDALPLAQQLLSGGSSQIKEVASLQGQLGKASSTFANSAANDLYGAGVQAAQGLVKGLQSQQAALDKQMRKIADSMTKSIKKSLGIHSPSRIMRDEVGAMMGAGIAEGIARSTSGINNAVTGTLTSARVVGVKGATRSSDVATGQTTSIDRSFKAPITINEARDPLGSAGRIGAELDKWGRM